MTGPRIACQTYAWQMSGDYIGRLDHVLGTLGDTGFAGVEPETQFLGELADPARMADALAKAGVELAAICLVENWLGADETDDERRRADETLAFVAHFPGTLVNLCQMPTTRPSDPDELRRRQANVLACAHAVAARAGEHGIRAAYHPNSPDSSILRTADDYRVLFDGLDERLGWVPDTGHIARAGMDPLALITTHRDLVRHVHFKDMDAAGAWVEMGRGVIDHAGITRLLAGTGFDGWIVVEDESERAVPSPDDVTRDDWRWVEQHLAPLIAPTSPPPSTR